MSNLQTKLDVFNIRAIVLKEGNVIKMERPAKMRLLWMRIDWLSGKETDKANCPICSWDLKGSRRGSVRSRDTQLVWSQS